MKKNVIIGVACVVLASLCYSITPILSNAALNGGLPAAFVARVFGSDAVELMAAAPGRALSNESVVGISMCIACILSLLNCFAAKKTPIVHGKTVLQLCAFGGGAFAVTCLLISFAYNFIPAGMTIVLHFTYPVFVVLAGMLLFRERITAVKLVSLLAAIGGIALMSSASFRGEIRIIGIVLALLSGMTYAGYFIAGRRAAYSTLDTSVSNIYITGSAGVICLVIGLCTGRLQAPQDWFMWLILFLEALLGYVIGLRLLLNGIRLIGSAPASALNTLEPAFASLTSMVVFGEAIGLTKALGIVLVLAAALASIVTIGKQGLEEDA